MVLLTRDKFWNVTYLLKYLHCSTSPTKENCKLVSPYTKFFSILTTSKLGSGQLAFLFHPYHTRTKQEDLSEIPAKANTLYLFRKQIFGNLGPLMMQTLLDFGKLHLLVSQMALNCPNSQPQTPTFFSEISYQFWGSFFGI